MSSAPDPFATSSVAPHPVDGGPEPTGKQSVGQLVAEVSRDLSTLIRQEVELAKAEVAQSAKRAGKGAGMFGGAGIAGHMVLVFLSISLWWALATWIGGGWSALVVAALWAVIAAVLAARGRAELRAVEGLPKTAESVKKIPDALRGHEERNS
ncbi:phage holin family protein [Promicromonospora sukumoe]|uniref:phage holin family protein n=1 Tax=Promicromonospora sukumoe TaxID=88382 RepID=UPI003649049D